MVYLAIIFISIQNETDFNKKLDEEIETIKEIQEENEGD